MQRLAHDIRQHLTAVAGFSFLIERCEPTWSECPKLRDYVDGIRKSVACIESILADVVPPAPPTGDVNAVIRELSQLTIWREVMDVRLDLAEDIPLVPHISGSALHRTLNNLCSNAKHAMLRSHLGVFDSTGSMADVPTAPANTIGTLTISTRSVPGGIAISVTDTGYGMNEEEKARCLRRMHGDGEEIEAGHGHGLQSALAETERMGGRIYLKSQPGAGTTFTIILPAAAAT